MVRNHALSPPVLMPATILKLNTAQTDTHASVCVMTSLSSVLELYLISSRLKEPSNPDQE